MLGYHLIEIYYSLSDLGLVRSKREFSRALGHHWSYVRDLETRALSEFRVPSPTIELLRAHLLVLLPHLSKTYATEIEKMVGLIDQHTAVTGFLGYTSRKSRR